MRLLLFKKITASGLILIFINSCGGSEVGSNKGIETQPIEPINTIIPCTQLPKFSTITEMIDSSYDYRGNCFELIRSDVSFPHIRISSEFIPEENYTLIIEQVKRDIVYVCFQAFAETDLDKITITSIPIIRSSYDPNQKYDGKLIESMGQTVTVTRSKAIEILLMNYRTTSFIDLYEMNGTLCIPGRKFKYLEFDKLEDTFSQLSN